MNEDGFSVIELLITVAIIGILAAIALPHYKVFRIKTHRAEAILALNTISKSQWAHKAINDEFYDSVCDNAIMFCFITPVIVDDALKKANEFLGVGFTETTQFNYQYEHLFWHPVGDDTRGFWTKLRNDFDEDGISDTLVLYMGLESVFPSKTQGIPYLEINDLD